MFILGNICSRRWILRDELACKKVCGFSSLCSQPHYCAALSSCHCSTPSVSDSSIEQCTANPMSNSLVHKMGMFYIIIWFWRLRQGFWELWHSDISVIFSDDILSTLIMFIIIEWHVKKTFIHESLTITCFVSNF